MRCLRTILRSLLLAVVALLGANLTRRVTADLNGTIGAQWPFSLTHCHIATAPGCDASEQPVWREATW